LALLEVSVERLASREFLGSSIPNEIRVSTGGIVAGLEIRSVNDGVTIVSRDDLETALPVVDGKNGSSSQVILRLVKENDGTEGEKGQNGEGDGKSGHLLKLLIYFLDCFFIYY